jgi:hypothetical protein
MSKYPYPESENFPDDASALDYQLNWNDRWESGEPVRSYRFDYRLMHASPAEDLPRATNYISHQVVPH